jgi:hypothetical protein
LTSQAQALALSTQLEWSPRMAGLPGWGRWRVGAIFIYEIQ